MAADVVLISVVKDFERVSLVTVIVYTYVVLSDRDPAGTVAIAPE